MKFITTLFIWSIITIIFLLTYEQGLSIANKIHNGALYSWNGRTGEWWRVATYGFLHNNTNHFLGNLILGVPLMLYLENKTNGIVAYMTFLLGIIIGGIGFLLFNEKVYVITLGASAGVWAMLSASMVVLLSSKIKTKINLIEFLILFNTTMMLFYDTYVATNVNKISHVAGYLCGIFFMLLLILRSREKKIFIQYVDKHEIKSV